ncbi:SNase-domain-containing protein [Hortaea werneckii]|nr:SNase-domain-containing protein [Hortaea werneckii]
MCTQFEYKCYFEKHPRKRSKIVEQNEAIHDGVVAGRISPPDGSASKSGGSVFAKPEPTGEDRPGMEDATKLRSMEANSGIAFTRLLGLRLDPSSGPKLFTFGWNLGSSTYTVPNSPPITDILAQDQMHHLAKLYWTNVHPLYGFIDRTWMQEQMNLRWARPDACKVPDHIIAGITAVGAMFANGAFDAVLPRIVDAQKEALESTSAMQPPTLLDVQSWVLRTIHLRMTDHPHAVWIASSTTMHLVESVGIHQESSSSTLHPPANEHMYAPELRRRTFWVARMLNTWVSFEYGRTRVALRGITSELPAFGDDDDFTREYIDLYSLSCCLDPERTNQVGQWEDFLKQLEAYDVKNDVIQLSKANLTLCGYRRLRLANPILSSETITRIINVSLKGLEAARKMAAKARPWWHVANVPFQVICIFLAMDVRESLANIHVAMRALEEVVHHFNTVALKEALKTARFLVRLSKKRKEEDSDVLSQSLIKDNAAEDPQPENLKMAQLPSNGIGGASSVVPAIGSGTNNETPMTNSSGEDWNMDQILNNSDFDWNYFLTADMPAFNSFAPDGTIAGQACGVHQFALVSRKMPWSDWLWARSKPSNEVSDPSGQTSSDPASSFAVGATQSTSTSNGSEQTNGGGDGLYDETPSGLSSRLSRGSWESNLNSTDWSHYTSPQTIVASVLTTAATLALIRLYKTYLRRIPNVDYLKPGFFRHRSLYGYVTRVGDGDNFHLYHTPGGKLAGWGLLPWRRVQDIKKFKGKTLPVRIAGVDAPERAHWGNPEQPYGNEALEWLRSTLLHRYVRVYPYSRDQYGHMVASVHLRRWLVFRSDVGYDMLKKGWATVYEAKSGSEFGGKEEQYRAAEARAKQKKVGMWQEPGMLGKLLGKKETTESPREYKTRTAAQDKVGKVKEK